jgi:hypothetical protein
VFLLSPAYCGGRRALQLLSPSCQLPLAQRLQDGTVTLGETFAFLSSLYFRGKLAYAQAFTDVAGLPPGVLVITPTRGLQPPSLPVSRALLREFGEVDVMSHDARYRGPLEADTRRLASSLTADARVVLLGSIATNKYVDVLLQELGDRLYFPLCFVGRGDMSRGGILLRSAAAGVELDYVRVASDVPRHGARPPRLPPLPPSRSALRRTSPKVSARSLTEN